MVADLPSDVGEGTANCEPAVPRPLLGFVVTDVRFDPASVEDRFHDPKTPKGVAEPGGLQDYIHHVAGSTTVVRTVEQGVACPSRWRDSETKVEYRPIIVDAVAPPLLIAS